MQIRKMRLSLMLVVLVVVLMSVVSYRFGRPLWARVTPPRTVADVLNEYGPQVEPKLSGAFQRAGLSYPPAALALLAFKQEKRLEVWGKGDNGWVLVNAYPVLAASGSAGPKLKEGDRQVPEGVYRIEGLNPNSRFHLSMKVNYPNAFDRARAREDGRSNLGGDIFIHGRAVSIGCLAIGDAAIEELFVLVGRTGARNVQVIIAPHDMRRQAAPVLPKPVWLPTLYADIAAALSAFPTNGQPAR